MELLQVESEVDQVARLTRELGRLGFRFREKTIEAPAKWDWLGDASGAGEIIDFLCEKRGFEYVGRAG